MTDSTASESSLGTYNAEEDVTGGYENVEISQDNDVVEEVKKRQTDSNN